MLGYQYKIPTILKNDIRRSISETNYGVGTYKWFRTYEEAEKYS